MGRSDAQRVLDATLLDVLRYFRDDVEVLGAWVESDTSICVVYRRTIDPELILGGRFTFPPHAAPDDPESSGQAFAEELREPIGVGGFRGAVDAAGTHWLGMAEPPACPFGAAAR
ncbi:hypothetical protein [Microbacterium sp. bgisy189]|uniref:hypothetical protein n=1 Tax=Microbacterium sp. bgisy189 TaxID=3413798 RepID=UPI003EBA7B89